MDVPDNSEADPEALRLVVPELVLVFVPTIVQLTVVWRWPSATTRVAIDVLQLTVPRYTKLLPLLYGTIGVTEQFGWMAASALTDPRVPTPPNASSPHTASIVSFFAFLSIDAISFSFLGGARPKWCWADAWSLVSPHVWRSL